jgi:uncharacterized membrane protein
MLNLILQYVIIVALFLAIDALWLSTIGRALYVAEIGSLMLERPNFGVAFAFYLLFCAGMLVFVVAPGLTRESILPTVLLGGLFGLVAYGTFDLTNYAVLKGFTAKMAIIDMAWGAALTAAVCGVSVWLIRLLSVD